MLIRGDVAQPPPPVIPHVVSGGGDSDDDMHLQSPSSVPSDDDHGMRTGSVGSEDDMPLRPPSRVRSDHSHGMGTDSVGSEYDRIISPSEIHGTFGPRVPNGAPQWFTTIITPPANLMVSITTARILSPVMFFLQRVAGDSADCVLHSEDFREERLKIGYTVDTAQGILQCMIPLFLENHQGEVTSWKVQQESTASSWVGTLYSTSKVTWHRKRTVFVYYAQMDHNSPWDNDKLIRHQSIVMGSTEEYYDSDSD